jgi:SAM-dependent methyltransferase
MGSSFRTRAIALVDQRTQQFRGAAAVRSISQSPNAYQGLIAHAKPGLHAHVARVMIRHVEPGTSVLDLAAGSGALALRLQDAGYVVSAADYVKDNFRLHGKIPFWTTDLNTDFAEDLPARPGAIVACEIIEHLENPRHFLRQCRDLLAPGGTLLLTTPNASSPVSKTLFLRSNHFGWFSDRDYEVHGHINPMTTSGLRQVAEECGFDVRELRTFGSAWDHVAGSPRLRLLSILVSAFDPQPADLRRDIIVAVLTVPGPGAE